MEETGAIGDDVAGDDTAGTDTGATVMVETGAMGAMVAFTMGSSCDGSIGLCNTTGAIGLCTTECSVLTL